MDKAKLVKGVLTVGALALGAASTFISGKVSENEMKKTVAKEVAEALANQAKES